MELAGAPGVHQDGPLAAGAGRGADERNPPAVGHDEVDPLLFLLRLLALHRQEHVIGVARSDTERTREGPPASERAMQLYFRLPGHHDVVVLADVEPGEEVDWIGVGGTVATRGRARRGEQQARRDHHGAQTATDHQIDRLTGSSLAPSSPSE